MQLLKWLGGQVDITVEVSTGLTDDTTAIWDVSAWNEATWGADDIAWQDLTGRVEEIWIDRGQARWDTRFGVGVARLVLDNDDGALTPGSGFAPWGLPWRPGRIIRVRAHPDGDDPVALYTGRISSSTDGWSALTGGVVTVANLVDLAAELSNFNPLALETATGVQSTADRVSAALDRYGWDGDTDIQTGEHTVQTSFLAQSTLEECQRAADAEGGAFFVTAEGVPTFKARDWLELDERSVTVQGYVGHEADEVPPGSQAAGATDVEVSWEDARIKNVVQFARVGGTVYEVSDSQSIALYGKRTYRLLDFQNNSDDEVEHLADRYLAVFKDNRMRVESVTIAATVEDAALNRLFYDVEFGDLLAVKLKTLHGWHVETETHVFGITDHITGNSWRRTFRLDDAAVWLADDSSSSS